MAQRNSSVSNEFNAKLKSLNLNSVAQILITEKNWTHQQVERAISNYKRYLSLIHQNPSQNLVPTKQIDDVLHTHIELGVQFDEDCQFLFGCVLQHEAGFGNGDKADQQAWSSTFRQTRKLFKQLFGFALTRDPAHCYTSFLASLG